MATTNQIPESSQQVSVGHWANSLWFRALFVAILILGVFFRLSGLGNKIYSHDESYTSLYAAGYVGDDVFEGIWNGKDVTAPDIQRFLRPTDEKKAAYVLSLIALYSPHQAPLFFLLEHYWMYLIGYNPAQMRGLAALFGLLSIPAIYWFSREMFQSIRTALVSTALFAISPFHVLFAQDARPYSLWALATLLSGVALLRAMRKDNTMPWLIYSLTLIVGLYSHQLFILVILAQSFYFISVHLLWHKKKYAGYLFAGLLTFVAYTPWLFYVITRWQHIARQVDILNMQIPWTQYIKWWVLSFSSPFIDLDFTSGNLLPYLLRALILVFIAYALVYVIMKRPIQLWILPVLMYITTAGSLILADLFLGGMRSITGRYFVPANLMTILIVAYFLTDSLDRAYPRISIKWRILVSGLIAASVLSNLNSLQAETWWNKELSRITPGLFHEINKDQTLLLVSGSHPTNLGDVLSLGFAVDSDVHFKIYEDPDKIQYSGNYQNIYWFPSSYEEFQEISKKKNIRTIEVMQGTLWRIDEVDR
jgi:uncharacterized membrane protein